MKIRIAPLLASTGLILAMLACNMPSANQVDPIALSTSVAQTVVAQMSASPQPALVTVTVPPVSATMAPISQVTPSLAPGLPTVTTTAMVCNRAQFVEDLSIPDGSNLQVGAAFTKTWRLKNVGTCTWSSGYQLVFDHGDSMGGPAAQALVGVVPPDQTIDISVNLVTPGTPGSYKGFWKVRDASGNSFGLSTGPFWVEINAVSPTAIATGVLAPPVGSITATLVAAESGSVRSNGAVFSFANVGDTDANLGQQGFLSFDISALPAGAVILEVKTKFNDHDSLGNPFSLGCLRMYLQDFSTVDAGDYVGGPVIGALGRWCSVAELDTTSVAPDLKAALQTAVGSPRFRTRLQFNENVTNTNAVGDMLRFGSGLQLQISFTAP